MIGDFFQSRIRFREVAEFGGDVTIVPAVVIDADFIEKLEEDIGALEGVGNGIALIIPWHQSGWAAEWIGESVAHDVPVGSSETAMLFHGFPCDDLFGVVLLECERIFGFWAFVLDFWDIGKVRHVADLWVWLVRCKIENNKNASGGLIRVIGNHNKSPVSRPVDTVIEFLQSEKARGLEHIFLDDEARDGLRELFIRSKKPVQKQAEPQAAKQVNQALSIQGSNKREQLESIRQAAEKWAPAVTLGSLRETMVFATGNPDARVMLIGEAPGYNEEKECEPFVGPAGQKLNDILKAMGISRQEVYISNLVKFRPSIPRQTTNNRKPTPEEMAACLPLVMAEISVVKPEIIIALGGTAAEGLIGLEGTVGSMRGKWHEVSGIPARVTYHPSYLLQSGGSNDVKRALWEDMLAAMEKLGMPISDKQRAFFLPKSG